MRGIWSRTEKKANTRRGAHDQIDARFNSIGANILDLRFIRVPGVEVGYRSVNDKNLQAPVAIFDTSDGKYHRPVYHYEEPLEEQMGNLGRQTAQALAEDLHTIYPRYEIFQRLLDIGIELEPLD